MKNVILALAVALFSTNALAMDDGKNDAMCMAINLLAYEQYETELEEVKTGDSPDLGRAIILQIHLEHYGPRVALFQWKYEQGDTYDKTVFDNLLDRYLDEIDTATVLLHMDRCEHRIYAVYDEYLASKN